MIHVVARTLVGCTVNSLHERGADSALDGHVERTWLAGNFPHVFLLLVQTRGGLLKMGFVHGSRPRDQIFLPGKIGGSG